MRPSQLWRNCSGRAISHMMNKRLRRAAATQPDTTLQALKRLRATFKWRAQELPRTLRCTICDGNPKAHFMHVVSVNPKVPMLAAQAQHVTSVHMFCMLVWVLSCMVPAGGA